MSENPKKTLDDEFEKLLVSNASQILSVCNQTITSRTDLFQRLLDPRRDYKAELGYPLDLYVEDYSDKYERNGIAARVVDVYPDETWKTMPRIFETADPSQTPFEEDMEILEEELGVLSQMRQLDILSGIGHFGVMLIGFEDGAPLDQPVGGGNGLTVGYLRPLDNSVVSISNFVTDATNPRFGLPEFYEIGFNVSTNNEVTIQTDPEARTVQRTKVHWTRVVHAIDHARNSPVFGEPRMKRVFNYLTDLEKVLGGSAEMFWRGGFPGIALESQPGLTEKIEFDQEATKQMMDKYMNGLQRYLALVGMSARTLEVQISDPKNFWEAQMRAIATSLAVPWRVFLGSEAAQLASDQDSTNWNARINARRKYRTNSNIIRPFINRLIEYGVVRPPKDNRFKIKWDDLNMPTDLDRAKVADMVTKAIGTYVQTGADVVLPIREFFTEVIQLDRVVIDRVMEIIDEDAIREMQTQDVQRLMEESGESNGDIENA